MILQSPIVKAIFKNLRLRSGMQVRHAVVSSSIHILGTVVKIHRRFDRIILDGELKSLRLFDSDG